MGAIRHKIPGGGAASGIVYSPPPYSGQTTSYRTGDDAYILSDGGKTYAPPTTPELFALLDPDDSSPFTTLEQNNLWGNKNRFTDLNGLQVYGDGITQDHFTGLMWPLAPQATTVNWNDAIDDALSSTLGGFDDWYLPDIYQMGTILQPNAIAQATNYAPFNFATNRSIWTSTTIPNTTTKAYIYTLNIVSNDLPVNINRNTKTATSFSTQQMVYWIVRKFAA